MVNKTQVLTDFFQGQNNSLDCYLIEDIKTLINDIDEKKCGGCGYPLFLTLVSACELMGRLLSGKNKKTGFNHFITNYLHDYIDVKDVIWDAGRNSAAHLFFTSYHIVLQGSGPNFEIKNDRLKLNIKAFATSFISGYEKAKKHILSSKHSINESYLFLEGIRCGMKKYDKFFSNTTDPSQYKIGTQNKADITSFNSTRGANASISPIVSTITKLK